VATLLREPWWSSIFMRFDLGCASVSGVSRARSWIQHTWVKLTAKWPSDFVSLPCEV
jgi:hypothetical protein